MSDAQLVRELRVELKALHAKTDVIVLAIRHLLTKDHSMSANPALIDVQSEIQAIDSDIDQLIAAKSAADAQAQSDDAAAAAQIKSGLDAIKSKVEAALTPVASTSTANQAQASAPVTSTSTTSSGATVTTTVDPSAGQTTATVTDPTSGATTVTTVDHSDGSASTVDSTGTPVSTDPEAVQAATSAAQAAGVTVPASS